MDCVLADNLKTNSAIESSRISTIVCLEKTTADASGTVIVLPASYHYPFRAGHDRLPARDDRPARGGHRSPPFRPNDYGGGVWSGRFPSPAPNPNAKEWGPKPEERQVRVVWRKTDTPT